MMGEDGTIWAIHDGSGAGDSAKIEALAPGDYVGMALGDGAEADQSNLNFQRRAHGSRSTPGYVPRC
jgi:hypothetical protein